MSRGGVIKRGMLYHSGFGYRIPWIMYLVPAAACDGPLDKRKPEMIWSVVCYSVYRFAFPRLVAIRQPAEILKR